MNKLLKYVSLLLIFTLAIGINTADAQKRKTKRQLREEAEAAAKKNEGKEKETKNMDDDDGDVTEDYFDDKGGFKHRLWYGGGFNLAFGGSNFGGSSMLIGISPMVGYKITDRISLGPRVSVDYQEIFLANITNPRYLYWGVGAFGRARFMESLFAHVEYAYESISPLNDIAGDVNNLDPHNFYIGGGYHTSSGGPFGYEILVLYNTTERDTNRLPIDFRIGFTWNF